jgi:hypothetical protein
LTQRYAGLPILEDDAVLFSVGDAFKWCLRAVLRCRLSWGEYREIHSLVSRAIWLA